MRAVLLVTLLLPAIPVRPERPQAETQPQVGPQQLIIGDWLCEKVTSAQGQNLGTPGNNRMIFRILPGQSIFIVNGKDSEHDGLTGAYTIDWTANPPAMHFRPKRGGKLGGLIRLEGDLLVLALGGETPPMGFGSASMIAYYRRVKN